MDIRELDKFLLKVQKPARYTGGETNIVIKNFDKAKCKVGFCFPDTYEIGMSHIGMKILYHLINEREDSLCERFYAPWPDMEDMLKENNMKLFSLENKKSLDEFDIAAFTLQYEMSYTNILNMLSMSDIPLRNTDRKDGPFVCFGGPCAYNCEPIADFADFVVLGEAEEVFGEIIEEFIKWKKSGESRLKFLESIAKIEGVYVPSFYDVIYNEDGTVKEIKTNNDNAAEKPRKRIIKDLDSVYYPEKPIVPFTEIVHDRIMMEIFRGCTRSCRFCQAGYIYRPVREKSPERIVSACENLIKNTGYDEITLSSLSTSDYSCFNELADKLIEITEKQNVSLSLPSLRVDNFSVDLMKRIQKVRKSGLTFAPEAGSQRLRDIINKNVKEEDLLNTSKIAFSNGWNTIKLYFMIGLPLELDEDVTAIADLAEKVVNVYFEAAKELEKKRGVKITVSTSTFVPKPFTPFQWDGQDEIDNVVRKQTLLKKAITRKQISYNWHESKLSFLEAVFARGDRRLSDVIELAHKKGCKFDSWNEHFKYDSWLEAFEECGINPEFYANRKREYGEVLPWSHIDVGVSEKYLMKERIKAEKGETTDDCRNGCTGCGATVLGGGACIK